MSDHATFLGFVSPDGKLEFDFPSQYRAFIGRFKGREMEVEIREKGRKKTRAQESGFHALITPWAREEGHDIDDLKRYLLGEIFGYREDVSALTGQKLLNQPRTRDLTVAQYSELIERTLEIAAWAGVILEAPDEYTKRKESERKKAARKAA